MKTVGFLRMLLAGLGLCGALALAEPHETDENEETTGEGKEAGEEDARETMIDGGHRGVSRWILRRVERLNAYLSDTMGDGEDLESDFVRRFYGDRVSPYDVEGSHIRVTPNLGVSRFDGADPGVDFSARIRLRNLSRRLRFYADSYDVDDDSVGHIFSERYRSKVDEDRTRSTTAGLTYMLSERVRRQISVSGGMKFRPEPVPQLRLRARWRVDLDPWEAAFAQSVFWDSRDGFGERSEIEFRRPIREVHELRFHTSFVWSEVSQGVDWGQHASLLTMLEPERHVMLRVGAVGHTEPAAVVDKYLTRISYRQPAYRDWVFWGIETGVDFPREHDYQADPMVRVKVDILLGSP
ncbi:MAG: hypothetical protein LAT83_00660 [Kiritimatiellae bacterium]|nr:hypothetical protein [Kiritimatiellia bacterium]